MLMQDDSQRLVTIKVLLVLVTVHVPSGSTVINLRQCSGYGTIVKERCQDS